MPTLLVIDDEESVRYSFRYVYEADGIDVLEAGSAAEGWELVRKDATAGGPDVIVLDLQLPDRPGLELLRDLRELDARRPVLVITAHGTADTAIEAMKAGAFDYLVKPVDLEQLSQLLERAFAAAHMMKARAVLPGGEDASPEDDQIIARSRVMQEMCKAIGRIAPQDVNVLILGESGTGKELVARALYQHSKRAGQPFLAINCAAIPETLLESELFGHEKGAFTGAERRRIGKFEQADGGTLFLDEIGDMQPALQAKMLRVLQEQRFQRLGSNETVQTRVRVLAATNQDLEKLVAEGRFRADLYYRLKGVTVSVPPLRERSEDVAELARYFLLRFNAEMGLDVRSLAPEALARLESYSWPGNVRELRGVIQQAMLNSSGHILLAEFLPAFLNDQSGDGLRASLPAASGPARGDFPEVQALVARLLEQGTTDVHARVLEAVERVVFEQVLRHTRGHQGQASQVLGISRATLRHKLRALGLAIDRVLTEEAPGPSGQEGADGGDGEGESDGAA
jgi:two-component system nitrogen regulation response regulator GlnG